MRWSAISWLAWILVVIGGLNWGLVGLFHYDLVGTLFGGVTTFSARAIYTLVGAAALWQIVALPAEMRVR